MITEKHKAFAVELIELARTYNLGSLEIKVVDSTYTTNHTVIPTKDEVHIVWAEGRWKEENIIKLKGIEYTEIKESKN